MSNERLVEVVIDTSQDLTVRKVAASILVERLGLVSARMFIQSKM